MQGILETWKLLNCQEIPNSYCSQKLITIFTDIRQWNLFWASSIQSTPYFFKIHFNIILPFMPSCPKWYLLLRFTNPNFVCIFISYMCHMFPDLITLIIFGEAYKLWNSSSCNFLHHPVPSSLLGPNVLPGTLFLFTEKLLHLHKMGKVIALYILIIRFLGRR